jgi:hypothetical protein
VFTEKTQVFSFTSKITTMLCIAGTLARKKAFDYRKARKVNSSYIVFINLSVPCASARKQDIELPAQLLVDHGMCDLPSISIMI